MNDAISSIQIGELSEVGELHRDGTIELIRVEPPERATTSQ